MKLKLVRTEIPWPVARRFPYLVSELHEMVVTDDGFRQLCQDYRDLVSTLEQPNTYTGDTKSELLGLRTTLEVEILEQVTRKGAVKRS
jgi:hypothetical protein